ncbi:MAG TPA: ABC transporter permease [Blastocatellia bacterium]|nr:ABC transporter permease [Blastocatellia bacterium]
MGTLFRDLRYGIRMLIKRPGFTAVAIVTLALGIGANTMIFSIVNAVVLSPLPFPDSARLVRIAESHPKYSANFTYATFLDLGSETESLANIAASRFWNDNLTEDGEPEQVASMLVSANFFAALGVAPHLGRTFIPEEDQRGGDNVVVISHGLWQRRYGADSNIIGRSIKVSGVDRTVIGVMPPGFQSGFLFPGSYELWVPLVPGGVLSDNRRSHLLAVIARLKPGATVAQAKAEMAAFATRVEQEHPGVDPELSFGVTGLQERLVAPIRPALTVLFCAVGCVLLIACANVANLLMARSAAREREMAIRLALGAGQWRVIRQLLTESALLGLLGGAAGLLLAVWGIDSITALNPGNLPRLNEVRIDGSVLGFTLIASLLTGVLFGLAPAFQLCRLSIHEVVKDGGRGSVGTRRTGLRNFLIVSEVALALVLLIGAGLLINSFRRLQQVDRGFDPENVIAINLTLPRAKYAKNEQQIAFLKSVLERIKQVPGVRSVGLTSTLPLSGGPATTFVIEGRAPADAAEEASADIRIIDPDYFRTLSIPLRTGRWFRDGDTSGAPTVMVINENMAGRFWPGEDPIGKRVTMKDWGPPLTGEIVGVVGDVKADGLDSDTRPMIYWPYPQFPTIFNSIVVRTDANSTGIVAAVKSQIWSVDPDQPIPSIGAMDRVVANSVAPRRFNMLLLGLFAGVALVLAAVGIYGVISYTVSQRTHEIGVRVALGARGSDVLKLVVGQGLTLALTGVGVGLAAAFGLTRLMTSLLFGVSPTDGTTFAVFAILLTGVALAACVVPARRAIKVDPMVALRYE